MRLLMFLD